MSKLREVNVVLLQEEQLLDLLMLSLRLSDGLDLQKVQRDYGAEVVAALLPAIRVSMRQGLMQLVSGGSRSDSASDPGGGTADSDSVAVSDLLCSKLQSREECRVRLTDPAGFLLSNDVISDLFAQLNPSLLTSAQQAT